MDDHSQRKSFDLYPEIMPFDCGGLAVDSVHRLYWEQSGNPRGVPALFVHGGPGAGSMPAHRRFFDPGDYRIIVFDQRGAGRSRPFAEIADNTTPLLIQDMERLRRHLGVDRWLLFGGSWGAALALAYAVAHPDRCLGFVLRGVFLGRRREVDWFLDGIRTFFPEAWTAFVSFLPEAERATLMESYFRRLVDPDPAVHMPAARAWSGYENACSVLMPRTERRDGSGGGASSLALARIEAHYFRNGMFLPENHILANLGLISHLPVSIVQGRYDTICPIVTADELARAWPGANYVVVPDAGHSAMEPGIRAALVGATERFKTAVSDRL